MKPLIIVFLLLNTITFAKECFKDKQAGEFICYKRYFDRVKLYKPKDDEKYYTSKTGKIYAIGDKIEVKFKSVGAILSILDDYEIDFVDKTKGEKYIFRVKNKNEIFAMLRILNGLNAIQKALPLRTQKYTKAYVEYQRKKRKEKLERIKDKLENPEKKKPVKKNAMPSGTQGFKFGG